jgi:hypothetical protein
VLLKVNKLVLYFIITCFIAMAIPYLWDFGYRDLFLRDFYAKRIMTVASLPFFLIVFLLSIKKKTTSLNKHVVFYLLFITLVLFNSLLFRNSIALIVLDAFVVMLPVFFYLLVYKAGFLSNDYSKYFGIFLVIACALVVIDVKLQFSYFSMLGIVYIIFLTRINFKNIILFVCIPILVVNTLIGKSALLMLIFMIGYFFLFDRKLVSRQKKIYLILIPSVLLIVGTILFWDTIKETGAYKNTYYFLRHADFENFKFTDMSTGHRIYEAQRVLEEYDNANFYKNLFGNGFGATIDLSDTKDVAVTKNNTDLTKVRHIHIGFFAVLHRFGILGIIFYFGFIYKAVKSCRRVLKHSDNYAFVLSALYILIIIFDSFISFPHMMSNFLFWLIMFVIFSESDKIRRNQISNLYTKE